MLGKIKNAVYKIDRWSGVLGNVCIVLNMLIVVYNVVARNFFSKSLAGITDYAGFISCLIVVLCLAYTETQNGHPRVDLIVSKFPLKVQKFIFALVGLLDIVVVSALSYSFFSYALSSAAAHTTSMNAKLPYAPFLVVCGLGMALFALTCIVKTLDRLLNWGGAAK